MKSIIKGKLLFMIVHLLVVIQIYNLFSGFLLFNSYYHSKCRMNHKCPTSYGKRLLSLNFSLTSLTSLKHYRHTSCCLCSHDECLLYIGSL